ncbi:MAG: hypothetical protein M1457_14025, partial [bacterium]|nr:hypothetical protein [bacterium]
VLACVVLGAALWSGEEHDPARAFIHTLPFSRARLLWLKLAALWPAFALLTILWLILWLAMLGMLSLIDIKIGRHPESFLLADFGKRALTPGIIISYVAITLVLGVFGAIVGAAAQLHFRTAILSTLVGIVTAALLNGMVLLDAFIRVGAAHEELDAAILAPTLARALVALGLMGGWLFFVFCRTALREQGPTARSLLGLLWIVGAAEVFAVAFFTNWRDLVFILFGA